MRDRPDAILQRAQADYLDGILPPADPLLAEMEQRAAVEGQPIADRDLAQLLRVLVKIRRPRRVLEIGTNIGYAVVVMGRELDEGALLETIEIDSDLAATARGFAARASLSSKVMVHEGAALEVLPRLAGPFDLVYIDCVKTEYLDYLDAVLPKMVAGGVIVADNVLWHGTVATGHRETNADALRKFNERIMSDPALTSIVLPIGDGASVSVVTG
ncbi:MAG TPA: O-methyltransferase [Thermoanaerobaculia bacterium]|nr:O-methyltransferase [Thermoanaerobaculia bacterium]